MTPAKLEQQSRDAVIAYLQDSSVRLEHAIKRADGVLEWRLEENHVSFYFDVCYYRIAPPKPWYRIALTIRGPYIISNAYHSKEHDIARNPEFIRWLTDRIEYTNE